MRPSVPDVHITDSQDAELAEYRLLASQAVVGLIFSLLAPLAFVDPLLWILPVIGVVFSWWALRRIRRGEPEIVGRKMAIFGFTFSLLFLAAAPSDWFVYRLFIRDEAREFSELWFQYIAQDEPEKAFQLTLTPQKRLPLDGKLAAYYRDNATPHEDLKKYVASSPVDTLLALGPKAQMRFYQTADQGKINGNEAVGQWYNVSYEEDGEKKSFFVLVKTLRAKLPNGQSGWRIAQVVSGKPDGE
jgi:hypothetical protein